MRVSNIFQCFASISISRVYVDPQQFALVESRPGFDMTGMAKMPIFSDQHASPIHVTRMVAKRHQVIGFARFQNVFRTHVALDGDTLDFVALVLEVWP